MERGHRTPSWLTDRVRENVRILKASRNMSNATLATQGGYTSRQLVDNRLTGRTPIDMDDVARLAAGLRVEPHVLLLRTDEALRWTEDHRTYKPPKYTKQSLHAAKSDIMRERRRRPRTATA